MRILLLCEPRSGSTNLAKWFSLYPEFTVFQEPLNPLGTDYKKITPVSEWKYDTKHLVVKEIYTPNKKLQELIEFSDKIILLYRENETEQLESWMVASETNQWSVEWMKDRVQISNENLKKDYFLSLKTGFKENYLNKKEYFKISYEELYYQNGIERILEHLNIECLENSNFPYGKKYRIEKADIKRLL